MASAEFHIKTWSFEDIELSYHEMGQGPCLVFLHGFASHPSHWLSLCRMMASDFTVIVPHLNSLSLGEESRTFCQQLVVLEQFVESLVLQHGPVRLVGNSYGGQLAANLRQSCGGMVHSVALLNPMPPHPTKRAKGLTLRLLLRIARFPPLFSSFLASSFGKRAIMKLAKAIRPETFVRFRGLSLLLNKKQKLIYHIMMRFSDLVNSQNWKKIEERLCQEGPDTLLLFSDQDQIFSKKSSDWWRENTLHSETVFLRNAEHMAVKSHASEVKEILLEFFISQESQSKIS